MDVLMNDAGATSITTTTTTKIKKNLDISLTPYTKINSK